MIDRTSMKATAGFFAISACTVALVQMTQHLRNYTHPLFQRYILRLIFMIPVYALASWLSLLYRGRQIYFDTIRDCYEAWVIYNFLSLCMAYVGGPGQVLVHMEGHNIKPSMRTFTCCFSSIPINGLFLRQCKQGALQFVLLKPVLATLTLILDDLGVYGVDELRTDRGFVWIMIVYNMSYTVALYSLLFFYLGAQDLLAPFKPVIKFLVVKAVVFLTFWQGMAISMAVMGGTVPTSDDARALQNFLICVEMLPSAVLMAFAFPSSDFKTPAGLTRVRGGGLTANVGHAISIHDVVSDTVHQFASSYSDYVCYSDSAGEAGASDLRRPATRHRTRTFILLGNEMSNMLRPSKISTEGLDSTPLAIQPLRTSPLEPPSPIPYAKGGLTEEDSTLHGNGIGAVLPSDADDDNRAEVVVELCKQTDLAAGGRRSGVTAGELCMERDSDEGGNAEEEMVQEGDVSVLVDLTEPLYSRRS